MQNDKEYKSSIEIERQLIKKYKPTLFSPFIHALQDFDMIKEGDKIAVCISGGKDSMLLAKLMQEVQKHGKYKFEIVFLCMNPGYNKKNLEKIKENANILDISLQFFSSNIFEAVQSVDKSPCYLCARMRRGYLYAKAKELGCNKIALGHHFNDVIETVLVSMLYGAEIKTMMPKIISKNFEGMELIRPMYYIKEDDIIKWAKNNNLEFINCACKFTEMVSNGENQSKRKEIKELIKNLKKDNPNVDINILRSTIGVNVDTLIGYKKDNVEYNFLDLYNEKLKNKNNKDV